MQEKHGPSGLLVGLIIGAAVGALVSTKKGRKILKDVIDYGIEYVGNTVDMEDIETILNDDEEEMMGGEVEAEGKVEKETEPEEPSRRKRLFRGIKRK